MPILDVKTISQIAVEFTKVFRGPIWRGHRKTPIRNVEFDRDTSNIFEAAEICRHAADQLDILDNTTSAEKLRDCADRLDQRLAEDEGTTFNVAASKWCIWARIHSWSHWSFVGIIVKDVISNSNVLYPKYTMLMSSRCMGCGHLRTRRVRLPADFELLALPCPPS